MKKTKYCVESVALDEIRPYDNNPRLNDGAVDACAESIRRFGFRQPIVVDGEGIIVVGHTRYKAARKLGLDSAPVHRAVELTPEQATAYRIADNKTSELAEWDVPKLVVELSTLENSSEFEPLKLGFSSAELARIFGKDKKDGLTDPDAAPDVRDDANVRPGTLYALGDHRLLCGDASRASDVARLAAGVAVDLCLTDPPYNVDYQSSLGLKIENDATSERAFRALLEDAFAAADSITRPGAAFYVWHADRRSAAFRDALEGVGWQIYETLIWVKNSLVFGDSDYQWRHEPCFYGWKPGDGRLWNGGRKETTVLEYDKPRKNEAHPTMKPVALFERLIRNSTNYGDAIYDPFAGSGASFIAAERLGRRCFGLEISPRYCDAIIRRWENFSGGRAVVVEEGEA